MSRIDEERDEEENEEATATRMEFFGSNARHEPESPSDGVVRVGPALLLTTDGLYERHVPRLLEHFRASV